MTGRVSRITAALLALTLCSFATAVEPVVRATSLRCQVAELRSQDTSDVLKENVILLFSSQAQSEPKGCCCLLKDAGPPPTWDCSGSTADTTVTKQQCEDTATETSAQYKWHAGQCTGSE
jgi:hypothetical protein